jgi:hypothetical protein
VNPAWQDTPQTPLLQYALPFAGAGQDCAQLPQSLTLDEVSTHDPLQLVSEPHEPSHGVSASGVPPPVSGPAATPSFFEPPSELASPTGCARSKSTPTIALQADEATASRSRGARGIN